MAAKTFECCIITPQAKLLDHAAVQAILPAWDGLIGVLHNRAPLVTKLGTGELRLDLPGEAGAAGGSRSYFVDQGFAHMVENRLTILAGAAIPAEQLNEAEAKAELAEAEARETEGLEQPAADRIRHERARARVKLRVARAFRERGGAI